LKWGIIFRVPLVYESELWELPPPTLIRRLSGANLTIEYSYMFEYAPQSWKEWQRVASMKIQIQKRIRKVEFIDYENVTADGIIYTISELGKSFKAFIKFPQPQFPDGNGEAYKMLCRHAKRLHYEEKLHIEQLIATSIRFNNIDSEGISQVLKRAKAAYLFSLTNKDSWNQRLSKTDLETAHKLGASKTNVKKQQDAKSNKLKALELKKSGSSINDIAAILNVHRSTITRYLK